MFLKALFLILCSLKLSLELGDLRLDYAQILLLDVKCFTELCVLGLSHFQRCFLWNNDQIDVVELVHGKYPSTKVGSHTIDASQVSDCAVLVGDDGLKLLDRPGCNVLFVILPKGLQESHIGEKTLRRRNPVFFSFTRGIVHLSDGFLAHQDAHTLEDSKYIIVESLQRTELSHILLLDGIKSFGGSFKGWQGLIKIFLAVQFDAFSLIGGYLGNCCFSLDLFLHLLGFNTFCFDDLGLLVNFSGLDDKLWLERFKLFLHLADACLGGNKLVVSISVPVSLLSHFGALRIEETLEGVNQLEVTRGGYVVVALLEFEESGSLRLCRCMECLHHRNAAVANVIFEIDIGEELLGHTL